VLGVLGGCVLGGCAGEGVCWGCAGGGVGRGGGGVGGGGGGGGGGGRGGSGHGPNEVLLLSLSSRTEKITTSGTQMKFEPRISRLQDKSLIISANRHSFLSGVL